ncbi:MAG: hypothetical protein ERJ68_07080 [Aphanocapsa feldmannii 277cI]|uniref:Ycf66 family protein n=1 Tax=Aphanocapsa feldmannii 277cI TaxID=2507554 RepID=A0A524RSH2_9CHRO|nr:MAG: hypothetical protein ERJ68_07080 [Aphanocapsa feldmannii 277cI]
MLGAFMVWASIVGIVLAVGGAFLYFLRSFRPALARDYDVFFAAVGLLCGGILFFQGWRLDPILQFGQFLLASTTCFFAYESVRLRGVTTEQARRSAYQDEDDEPAYRPRVGDRLDEGDRFEERDPRRRRIRPSDGDGDSEDDLRPDPYRSRRVSRAVIPEQAESRAPYVERGPGRDDPASRYDRGGRQDSRSEFGARPWVNAGAAARRGVARNGAPSPAAAVALPGPPPAAREIAAKDPAALTVTPIFRFLARRLDASPQPPAVSP